MHHNTIVLGHVAKIWWLFSGTKPYFHVAVWTLPEIWRDLHPWSQRWDVPRPPTASFSD